MRRDKKAFWIDRGILLGLGFYWLALASAAAQSQDQRPRPHAILPPSPVGTALSAQIEAEAKYLVARGDLMESAAIARKIHAEEFAKELSGMGISASAPKNGDKVKI